MNATPADSRIPEVRTGRATAIILSVAALFVLAVSIGLNRHMEDALNSSGAATAVLAAWCVLGVGTAIAAVVDAYLKPDGELLGLIVTIAATVFAISSLLMIAGIIVGASSETVAEYEKELKSPDPLG